MYVGKYTNVHTYYLHYCATLVGIKLKNSLIDVNPVDGYKYSMIISLVEELKMDFLVSLIHGCIFLPIYIFRPNSNLGLFWLSFAA